MAEYALTIFLVIGTVVAMTVYVKRGLQARMHDARHYMIAEISKDCGCDCKQAADLINNSDWINCETAYNGLYMDTKYNVGEQYEPYYAMVRADVNTNSIRTRGTSSTYNSLVFVNSQTGFNSESNQLPPKAAKDDFVLGWGTDHEQ